MIAIRRILLLCLITALITSCEQHGKVIVENIVITESEEEVDPPVDEQISHFKTLQDWLVNVCDSSKSTKNIEKFKFGLFEGKDEKTIYLVGTNTYKEGEHNSSTRIEFEPAHKYLLLPKAEYNNLSHEELVNKLTTQLKDFTNTNTFQNSFLNKANTVLFETNGQVIWKNGKYLK